MGFLYALGFFGTIFVFWEIGEYFGKLFILPRGGVGKILGGGVWYKLGGLVQKGGGWYKTGGFLVIRGCFWYKMVGFLGGVAGFFWYVPCHPSPPKCVRQTAQPRILCCCDKCRHGQLLWQRLVLPSARVQVKKVQVGQIDKESEA